MQRASEMLSMQRLGTYFQTMQATPYKTKKKTPTSQQCLTRDKRPYAQILQKGKYMTGLNNARPDMAEVYFPVHRYLRPENDYLERAALVYMIAGAPILAVQQAIPWAIQQELS
jgi:hypothetical protein